MEFMEDCNNKRTQQCSDTYKLIPCSMRHTYTCYVMYDGHPKDKKKIDITICLQGGKVVELFERDCVSSIWLPDVGDLKKIQIIRNNKGELFYLIVAHHKVIILSSTDQLLIHRRFDNVINHEVCDPDCSGEAKLKITTETALVCISFADVKEVSENNKNWEEPRPIITGALEKKLSEADYNLSCNKNAYEKIEKLRQQASFLCNRDNVLVTKNSKPIIKFCNKKIIIQLEVENTSTDYLNKVYVLVHNNSCNSISYTSKVYEHLIKSPFYKEIEFRVIKRQCKATIVAVIPITEFKSSIHSRIEFSVIVSYERQHKTFLLPFNDVHISAADVMSKNFDVFDSREVDEHSICLAMLSTTVKTTLCLKRKGIRDLSYTPFVSEIFNQYLEMDLIGEQKKSAVYKHSSHHILYGILINFDDDNHYIDGIRNEFNCIIDVYARSPSQVLALIHFIYDIVPFSLIVTLPNIQVTTEETNNWTPVYVPPYCNYTQGAKSLLNQSTMTLDYLDNCLKEMNKSNNVDKANIQIDLFAMGLEEFLKYKNNMLAEAENGFKNFEKVLSQSDEGTDVIEID